MSPRPSPLRPVVVVAALVLLGGLAGALLWPRGAQVTVWSEQDLEPAHAERDIDPAEFTDARRALDPEQAAHAIDIEVGDPSDFVAALTLRGRVIDPRARPLAGAQVHLTLEDNGRARMRKPVTTAADGTFAFRGPVRPGSSVSVLAMHPAFAPSQVSRRVAAQAAAGDLALGDIALGHGATVRGSVVLDSGAPAVGAEVRLTPESGGGAVWSPEARDRLQAPPTDSAGGFELAHLPPGSYRAVARAPERVAASSDSVALLEGSIVTLPPIVLPPGCLLRGSVVDSNGRGIDKARLTLSHPLPPFGAQQRALTDASGRFELDNLQPIVGELRVTATGYVTRELQVDLRTQRELQVRLDDGLRLEVRVRDALSGAPITAFAARARRVRAAPLPAPMAYAGRSRQELQALLSETSRSLAAQPSAALAERAGDLRRALLALETAARPLDARALDLPQDPGAIEPHADGRFVCEGLDAGVYVVDVKAADFATTRSAEVEVAVGQPVPVLDIGLRHGHVLRGRVSRSGDGAAVGGARVEIMLVAADASATSSAATRLRGPTVKSAISTDDGSFEMRNVPPGTYALRTSAARHETATSDAFAVASDIDGLRVVLTTESAVHGRVRGIAPGREGDVTVVAFADHRDIRTSTVDADGSYRLAPLRPSAYRVRAYLANARTAIRRMADAVGQESPPPPDVTLGVGEDRELDLEVESIPIGSLRGTVHVNGVAAGGYQVRLESPSPPGQPRARRFVPTVQVQIEADGTFALTEVEAGDYDLVVVGIARERVELWRQDVAVHAGVDSTVSVDVAVAALEGEVIAPEDGGPVDGVIQLRPKALADRPVSESGDGPPAITARVRSGRFRIDLVPTGAFVLEHSVPGERESVRSELSLSRGEKRHVVVVAGGKR